MAKKKEMAKAVEHGGPKIPFDYIKGQYFRVVRADGAIGAVTPNGSIHFSFYSERPAIPRRLVYKLAPDGTLGPQIESDTESRGSIVREMDVDVFVTVEVAESLRNWLSERISEAKSRIVVVDEKHGSASK